MLSPYLKLSLDIELRWVSMELGLDQRYGFGVDWSELFFRRRRFEFSGVYCWSNPLVKEETFRSSWIEEVEEDKLWGIWLRTHLWWLYMFDWNWNWNYQSHQVLRSLSNVNWIWWNWNCSESFEFWAVFWIPE